MKIKIMLKGEGNRYAAGYISDEVWQYIQDECDEDEDVYTQKLDDCEVPAKFKLTSDSANTFFYGYGPKGCMCNLIICDENDNQIAEIDLSKKVKDMKVSYASTYIKLNTKYFLWESNEKGYWKVNNGDFIDIDGEFDLKKLTIFEEILEQIDEYYTVSYIRSIAYDGVEYDISVDEKRDISAELFFLEEKDEEYEDEMPLLTAKDFFG